MINTKAADLGKLLTFEQDIRLSANLTELTHLICNRSREIVDFTQAALAIQAPSGQMRISGFSDIAVVDRTAPLVTWLEQQLIGLAREPAFITPSAEARETVVDLVPEHILILPLYTPAKGLLGAFTVTRMQAFSDDEKSLLSHMAAVFAHAIAAHRNVPLLVRAKAAISGRRKWAITVVTVLAMLFPVHLTAIAPAEITAADPFIVAAPMNGAVERVLVKPNQQVTSGLAIIQLVDIDLKNDLEIARRGYRIAEAELLRARQLAFSSNEDKALLGALAAEVELKRAEMIFAENQLARATIRAPHDGIAIIDDPRKWQGRPVTTGEQILKLAKADNVEVQVSLPVADAITLAQGSDANVFLDIDPFTKYRASVISVPYQSSLTESGILAYYVKARLTNDQERPRIGLRGSARLYGPRTTLFYYLFRRPITALRQIIGV
ncbi:HlyD family efflux transporter periplasmic adaptor subunit [Alphaproteobacteria bacterium]|nr:HlyD family efflux transporter periplasmic adaptor subunit [Alphaproteobacteria bacterium]MDA9581530.1 HlyD family efflux transporter periplasmic adaptor subunit [bacterium]MDA8642728.1 HlyD family efflux transporter periplasmic adaptor subunit [Alphaproteobacteria bacterium]MDB2431194.1 HlyD family efflux transporter periplasmic adaptor subunit [Alphaproteobacteria bacterium]MDB2462177.1 HlyD family efflux transporter periplasmic adaptor subunit [Alphaproteobacteria bacterium]